MTTSTDLCVAARAFCVNQISDEESEVDYPARPQSVSEVVASPSTVPVIGESFCQCERLEALGPGIALNSDCLCGEEDQSEQKPMNSVIHHKNTAGQV